jgi:hypothetical protein
MIATKIVTPLFYKQRTDKEIFKRLRSELPFNYATLLFKRYKQKNLKFSKSLIYKVAKGERTNVIIFEDLLQLADEHQTFLKQYSRFDKRVKIN